VKWKPPPKRHPELSVAIPASLVADIPHLREKTAKIGLIGRALAIFRVDEAIIFLDQIGRDQKREAELIVMILSYMETPQYLRKRLFRIRPELRYAGILPPLRTPHHPLRDRKKDLKIGEYREGVVTRVGQRKIHVEIGVEHPILVRNVHIPVGTRVTVRIIEEGKDLKVELADPTEIDEYWGYKVTTSKDPFSAMLREKRFNLVVATSRQGKPLVEAADNLFAKWKKAKSVLVALGSPTQGLQQITKQEHLQLEEISDFVVNTMPNQATATVRTEEALYATMAALDFLAAKELKPRQDHT